VTPRPSAAATNHSLTLRKWTQSGKNREPRSHAPRGRVTQQLPERRRGELRARDFRSVFGAGYGSSQAPRACVSPGTAPRPFVSSRYHTRMPCLTLTLPKDDFALLTEEEGGGGAACLAVRGARREGGAPARGGAHRAMKGGGEGGFGGRLGVAPGRSSRAALKHRDGCRCSSDRSYLSTRTQK
jgi:hypothetical protein